MKQRSPASSSSRLYEYIDLNDCKQGPFALENLIEWLREGYITEDLLVRKVNEEEDREEDFGFKRLGEVLGSVGAVDFDEGDDDEDRENNKATKPTDDEEDEDEDEDRNRHRGDDRSEDDERNRTQTTTVSLLDERLKSVFFSGTTNAGPSFFDRDDDEDRVNNNKVPNRTQDDDDGDDDGEHIDVDTKITNNNSLEKEEQEEEEMTVIEELDSDCEDDCLRAHLKRREILEQFEDFRKSYDDDDDIEKAAAETIIIPTTSKKMNKTEVLPLDPRLTKEAVSQRKLIKQAMKAIFLPNKELLINAHYNSDEIIFENNASANVNNSIEDQTMVNNNKNNTKTNDVREEENRMETDKKGKKNSTEDDETNKNFVEDVKNVQKLLLDKLKKGHRSSNNKRKYGKDEYTMVDDDDDEAEYRDFDDNNNKNGISDDEQSRSEGERSDISWGNKIGVYEDPRLGALAQRQNNNEEQEVEQGDQDNLMTMMQINNSSDEKNLRFFEQQEDEEKEQLLRSDNNNEINNRNDSDNNILLLQERESFNMFLKENPLAGNWWLPNEEDGLPTLGPFQWTELIQNLPGCRVCYRIEDDRWQFCGPRQCESLNFPVGQYNKNNQHNQCFPELTVGKKMEKENLFLPIIMERSNFEEQQEEEKIGEEEEEEEKGLLTTTVNFPSIGRGGKLSKSKSKEDCDFEDDDGNFTSDDSDDDFVGNDDDDDDDDDDGLLFEAKMKLRIEREENISQWFRENIEIPFISIENENDQNENDQSAAAAAAAADKDSIFIKKWFKANVLSSIEEKSTTMRGKARTFLGAGDAKCVVSCRGADNNSKLASLNAPPPPSSTKETINMRFKRSDELTQISASITSELYKSIMMSRAKKKIVSQIVDLVLNEML
jgi:hypothetical protein